MDNHDGDGESHSLEEGWIEGLGGDEDPSGTLESQFCWRESGRGGERWGMEERRWVIEDVIEEEKDAWEVVGETGWGRRDTRWRRCDEMKTLRVE